MYCGNGNPIMITSIRQAESQDLGTIREIYNWAILNTTSTFDTIPRTPSQMEEWLEKHHTLPAFVAVSESDKVVGWACLSPWSDRCAYAKSAEVSLYVDSKFHRKGIGQKLLQRLVEAAQRLQLHTLLSRVSQESEGSIALHKQNHFELVGHLKEVGEKFDRKIDVLIYQYLLKVNSHS